VKSLFFIKNAGSPLMLLHFGRNPDVRFSWSFTGFC